MYQELGLFLFLLMLLIGGCSKPSTDAVIADARSQAEQGNWSAAIIQLKNVLHDDPSSQPARLMLAKALYAIGDFSGARIEIQKAIESGESENETIPLLARIMLAQGDYAGLVKKLSTKQLSDQRAILDLDTSLAFAMFKSGQPTLARQRLGKVLSVDAKYARALLLQAGVELASGNLQRAEEIAAAVLQRDPADRDAWQLSGDIKRLDPKRLAQALEDYQHVVALKPDDPVANSTIIDIYLAQGDLPAAEARFTKMKAALPAHPATMYLGARIALRRGDIATASDMSQRLVGVQPDNVQGLVLAGMIATRARSLPSAEKYLARAVQLDQGAELPRRLLADVYLRSAQPDRALSVLKPSLDGEGTDVDSIRLAAQAELELGDMKAAETHYLRALKLRPQDPQLRSATALILISKGKIEEGYADLSAIAASDPGTTADLALIGAAASRGDSARALAAIDRLQRKQPKEPWVAALRGRVLLQQGNQQAAVGQFEQALAMDSKYYPAAEALARLSVRAGKLDEARKRFDDLLAADPKSVPALIALSDIRAASKAPTEEVVDILNRAISADSMDPRPRLKLIAFLEQAGYAKRALTAAQDAAASLPDNLQLLDALGTAQLASSDLQQARSTFKQLASLAPKSEVPYLRLSEVYLRSGEEGEAVKALKQALEVQPDSEATQGKLLSLHLRARRWNDALAIARWMQKRRPNDAAGWVAEGDVELKRRDRDAAIAAFKIGLSKQQPDPAPSRYLLALTSAGSIAQATTFADAWLASHPKDVRLANYAAEIEILRLDLAAAERHLLIASKIDPNDGRVLNNLAWVLARQRKAGAVAYAQRAVAAVPESAGYLDTLAIALLGEDQPKAAVDAAQKAQHLAPNELRYTMTLAKAYWRNGQAELARSELAKLQKADMPSANRSEVDRLAAEWGK